MISSIVFTILSLSVYVSGQVCNNAVQYSACSLNSSCGCFLYSFSDTMGVCGLTTEDCSVFTPCLSPNDACTQTGYVCVRHPRCNTNPICFPSTLSDQDTCPRITVSNYNGDIDSGDGRFIRPGGSGTSYYEAIQVVVDRTGTYTFTSSAPNRLDTHGYFYNDTFYPLYPSTNLIQQDDDGAGNLQFKLTVNLQAGVPYTLVVAPHSATGTGLYSINATGPGNAQMTRIDPMDLTATTTTTTQAPIITTDYANALTVNSANFTRSGASGNYYYHAIEVRVPVTGDYTFRSTATISDSYGYLYQGNFYPTYPQYNIVKQDDDSSGGRNFGFTATLRSDVTYILVVTTLDPVVTGSFDITVSGPSSVSMTPLSI